MAQAIFLQGSLMRHVAVMSFTASVGIMAIFAVDFIDMMFISMLGNNALAAAIGYGSTLLFFTNAINIGLSIAAGSLVARSLGQNNPTIAREYAVSVALFGGLIGILLPMILLPNLSSLLGLIGAEGETLQLAVRYVSIIMPTMAVMSVAMVAMAVLRAYGDARRSMQVTLFGGIVNAALDPLLIFGFGLGLDGAAMASVAARLTMAAYGLIIAIKVHNSFARPNLQLLQSHLRTITGIAGPAVLTNIATPIGSAIVTREIAKFGTDAVAGIAVIGRLMPVAFAVLFALSGAIGPIIGQNFGAKLYDRVWTAFTDGLKFIGVYVLLVAIVLFICRPWISAMFNAEGEMRTLIFLFCGPLALLQFFNGMIFVCNASFNNLGHPIYSTWINWGRHTLGTWPLVILGAHLYGASGVLIGQAIGGIFFAVIGFILVKRISTHLSQSEAPDPFAPQRSEHQISTRRGW